ncbi:MAG: glycosyltransferase family 4 protein [Halanaerobiales bacterium]|nr:glycosyltransferase family 4 protein [Halanaerobiales bacterium]
MKICFITPFYLPVRGGITTYVANLSDILRENDKFQVSIISRSGNGDITYSNGKFIFVLKTFFSMMKMKPQVVHSHAAWYALFPGSLYKMLNRNVVLIHTFHTEPTKKIDGFKKIVFEWLLSKCDAVTFVSNFLLEKICENLDIKTRKEVIYAGVSKKKVNLENLKDFKKKFLLEDKSPIISFIGPLEWERKVKGVDLLIESFKYVVDSYPEARLMIIGDGKFRHNLEGKAKEIGISSNVIFIGFLENVFVPLTITDIYTHISLQEGFPISLLEAMNIGKPVIATSTGGIPEIIVDGKNGILVKANPEAIAEVILKLYKDKDKMRVLGENAYKITIEKCSWSMIADEFAKIYADKVKDHQVGRR